MSKQEARGLATGMFIAALLLTFYYFLLAPLTKAEGSDGEKEVNEKQIAEQYLEKNQLVAVDKKEYETSSKFASEQKDENKGIQEAAANKDKEEADKKEAEKKAEEEVKPLNFSIESGMASSEVAEALQQAKIIQNAEEFINVLENKGLENAVQLGTFELQTGMSNVEVIEVITR
ncbi:endolytic transglycosylase MltG [Pseudalkalibacillus caeni]|uniref:Endolytic transglycosylase MltG n=1 Tax=Exobacillus caeni TaxID=2574798 RepID=A0A5R9FC95_9BACL|nr:endolytic transglycosylase MltG [Pseudalkalibacillus caeni]TLS38174.1 endolytic transglycosylase MltG [Pseudalkalibacillus caeni]